MYIYEILHKLHHFLFRFYEFMAVWSFSAILFICFVVVQLQNAHVADKNKWINSRWFIFSSIIGRWADCSMNKKTLALKWIKLIAKIGVLSGKWPPNVCASRRFARFMRRLDYGRDLIVKVPEVHDFAAHFRDSVLKLFGYPRCPVSPDSDCNREWRTLDSRIPDIRNFLQTVNYMSV